MLSFPPGTEMFQFPGSRGHPGIDARSAAPPGLSQPSTSALPATPRHPPRALGDLATPTGTRPFGRAQDPLGALFLCPTLDLLAFGRAPRYAGTRLLSQGLRPPRRSRPLAGMARLGRALPLPWFVAATVTELSENSAPAVAGRTRGEAPMGEAPPRGRSGDEEIPDARRSPALVRSIAFRWDEIQTWIGPAGPPGGRASCRLAPVRTGGR